MKKILYLMHISWDGIKQRPHFIAENLSKVYDTSIFYASYLADLKLVNNSHENLFLKSFYQLPLRYRIGLISQINNWYLKIYFKYILKNCEYDFIWITFPELYELLPKNLHLKIIYDCMDDAISFGDNVRLNDRLLDQEKKLIKDASIIFASSNNLIKKLNDRYKCENKIFLVRNAFGGNILDVTKQNSMSNKKNIKIGYVGSVSKWFDFESIKSSLENFKDIEYHMIGPIDRSININEHKHERVIFHGPVNHTHLYEYVKDFDCMIMPFEINELVLSVDPVKLYEYINYDKPIISVFYDELNHFSPYVYFYSELDDLNSVINYLIKNNFPKKYSNHERLVFLKNNSWSERTRIISEKINNFD